MNNFIYYSKCWPALLLLLPIAAKNLNETTEPTVSGIYRNCRNNPNCTSEISKFEMNMLKNMNASVDPCENFYEFSCGNFSTAKDHGNFFSPFKNINRRIKSMILDNKSTYSFKAFRFLNIFLRSCMILNWNNYKADFLLRHDKLDFFNETIRKLGSWPVVEGDRWNETDFSWIDYVADKIDIDPEIDSHFFRIAVKATLYTSYWQLTPSKFEFDDETASNSTEVDAYFNYMLNVSILLGANETQARAQLKESLDFELNLIKASNDRSENDSSNVGMSVMKMTEKWPSIDWIKLLNSRAKAQSFFTNDSTIFVQSLEYLANLEGLIQQTPKRVQANFLVWKTIQWMIPYVESFTLASFKQTYLRTKNPGYVEKFHKCSKILKKRLPVLVLALYIRKYPVDEQARAQVHQIVLDIRSQLLEILNQADWLDFVTRDFLITRLNSVRIVVGYPDDLLDDKQLGEFFQELQITGDDFLKDFLNMTAFMNKKLWAKKIWYSGSFRFIHVGDTSINLDGPSFYNAMVNRIVLGVEFLRNLFFSVNRPNYVNYATIGVAIAHEFGHCINLSKKKFDKVKIEVDQWSESAILEHRKAEKCLIEQFSNFTTQKSGQNLNGSLYIEENVADNIGIYVAYKTYQNWAAKNGVEPNFPNLPYDSNQLFWLSYANQWCKPKASIDDWPPKDIHPPTDKRVIGSLSNSRSFSKDLHCRLGSRMNPPEKCSVF